MPRCLPRIFCLFLFVAALQTGRAQSVADLEAALRSATTDAVRWEACFKLARKTLNDAPDKAAGYAEQARALAAALRDPRKEAQSLITQADIALRQAKNAKAYAWYAEGQAIATTAALPELRLQAVEARIALDEQKGDFKTANALQKERSALLLERAARYHEQQKQQQQTEQEAALAERERRISWLWYALGLLLLGLLVSYYLTRRAGRRIAGEMAEKNALIEEKRRRSEQLLLNILPRAVAAELTVRNKVAARRYENATVMFIDFVSFTQFAEKLEPEVLVEELDYCFARFDSIISRYRVEKIKTVGDAYICASGLSDRNESPADMIRAALEIQQFLAQLRVQRSAEQRPCFEARIGIHFGPVVAGVVGTKKFAYDIWGDTVNTAARMEEACTAGRVNVSGTAQAMVAGQFQWEHRGRIAAKNKEEMSMWYVLS